MEKITRECTDCGRETTLDECVCEGRPRDTGYSERMNIIETGEVKVRFYSGYNGGEPKCEAEIEGKKYVIEIEQIVEKLEKDILEKGYEVSKTNRQEYERLHINS